MIYLSVGTRHMNENGWSRLWGHMVTPESGWSSIESGRYWAVDNGVFTGKFDAKEYLAFLGSRTPDRHCLFATAPDVLGDAGATMSKYHEWRNKMQPWPVAYVAQDGQENMALPECDAVFIGGTTDWKLGPSAECIREAQERDIWVHVGRVNTGKRIRHFALLGVDSVDGSALAYGPERNKRWIEAALLQRPLFEHP